MYDVIISGAGLAGSTAAKIIAEAGLKIIMFEKISFLGVNHVVAASRICV